MILPTIVQLRHFALLAQTLHFGRAAEKAFVTQSTLSASIRELEITLGVRLFNRDKRNVSLTDIGRDVLLRAQSILAQTGDLVDACQTTLQPFTGRFVLGAIPTIAPFVLPKLVSDLRRHYKNLSCYLREEQSAPLLEALRSGEVDAALIALPYDLPDSLVSEAIAEDPFVYVHSKNAAPLETAISIRQLSQHADTLMLLADGHCLREHAIASCRLGREVQNRAVSATSLATLIQMVESGLGTTLLPQLALHGGLLSGRKLVARPITPKAPSRTLALVYRKGSARVEEMALLRWHVVQTLPTFSYT